MSRPRLAIIPDFREEKWPSMDLVADMLLACLQQDYAASFHTACLCPPWRRRFAGAHKRTGRAFNLDRLCNRLWDYPRHLHRQTNKFDLFHIVDHSYSQLAHQLPPDRTVITCHDLDTFRCLLEPALERRSFVFRSMVKHIFSGLQRAARVTCDSMATRTELLRYGLVSPERTVVIPNGVHPAYSAQADTHADAEVSRLLGTAPGSIDLLHVGSTIPRKRIDVLQHVFAGVRQRFPQARLLRVGGAFSPEQQKLFAQLCLESAVMVLPFLTQAQLASIYRRVALVLQPSEREGFGLPVIEAMACGTTVVASDIAVLREVGGDAGVYCPVADVGTWCQKVIDLLQERSANPDGWQARRAACLAQAAKFSWQEYARKMVEVYRRLLV